MLASKMRSRFPGRFLVEARSAWGDFSPEGSAGGVLVDVWD
jgi:hypothetical protein